MVGSRHRPRVQKQGITWRERAHASTRRWSFPLLWFCMDRWHSWISWRNYKRHTLYMQSYCVWGMGKLFHRSASCFDHLKSCFPPTGLLHSSAECCRASLWLTALALNHVVQVKTLSLEYWIRPLGSHHHIKRVSNIFTMYGSDHEQHKPAVSLKQYF